MKKLELNKIVEKLKEGTKEVKPKPKAETKLTFDNHRVRDMRQEAMDMGSHGSKEFFTPNEDSAA